MKSHYLK